jgi:hypothetical protein
VSRRLPVWQLYERARSLGLAVQVSAQSGSGERPSGEGVGAYYEEITELNAFQIHLRGLTICGEPTNIGVQRWHSKAAAPTLTLPIPPLIA